MKNDTGLWKMVDELLDDESGRMTDWQLNFLESLNENHGSDLSAKQGNTIERIWDKVFG